MIEVRGVTCRRGKKTTVDEVSFTVERGLVTGFLGPNGAGKSTTMKMIAGMIEPSAGSATIDGLRYADTPSPIRHLGVLLEPSAVNRQRSARNHLRMVARTAALPKSRVDAVLEMAGLTGVADAKIGTFSLGMRQRLGIATALLGDPGTLMLDEPVNGLDPEGVIWLRNLVRSLAAEGRAVLLSSHLIAEMEVTADQVVVIGQGRILADSLLADLHTGGQTVRISAPAIDTVVAALPSAARVVERPANDTAVISGLPAAEVSAAAFHAGVILHEIVTLDESLETVFQELTAGAVDYASSAGAATAGVAS